MKTGKSASVLIVAIACVGLAQRLHTQSSAAAKPHVSAIEVRMIQSGEVGLPAEFQVALYEDLIQEFQKEGAFRHVYRDGDRAAANDSEVVNLDTTVKNFKAGSELERDVTTVGGATSITVHCQFKASDGTVLLERDIQGKVRLIGDNLKATDNLAKKAAKITPEIITANPVSAEAPVSQSVL